MRYISLAVIAALGGLSTVACTDDTNYPGRTQYGYNNAYSNNAYAYSNNGYSNASPRGDADGDGVPNYRDRRPNTSYRY